ncbi:DNA-binding transcriptional regulator, GntR family [Pseudarcicella hirudinis]|uniref:DNA-binding transcriptional regulator, GntR family n=2 Tax=Pseudarcicella hirudinis TaxID=1079859 RepID=A0A1I5ME85_9BACT|nr:GntR family transcriptional regulator [Pseudarcicella hirudinis]SFP07885.1 DNA-binding transcriptional regulator, GntR family [Pseudarcicella hirudinis]
MKPPKIIDVIRIDEFSSTPKYHQLANSILEAIQKDIVKKGDSMPSINEISFEFNIARVTVEKGYNYLRGLGVLGSVPGKGYYIKSTDYSQDLKIFLLFNKLSNHKKIIYDSFVEALGDQAAIDFYIYNNDFNLFKRLINNRKEDYTHYVIIPHFIDGEEMAYQVINTLPKEKLILLDKIVPQITGDFGAVYENFENDIYHALGQAIERLSKYTKLKIIFPENSYFPQEIIKGFENFCKNYAFDHEVVHSIENEDVMKGEAYVNLMEDDLVTLIDKIMGKQMILGQDVGIISYNETPLKRLILNGLTTISTDFKAMGKSTAELVLNNSKRHVENPFYLKLRSSL